MVAGLGRLGVGILESRDSQPVVAPRAPEWNSKGNYGLLAFSCHGARGVSVEGFPSLGGRERGCPPISGAYWVIKTSSPGCFLGYSAAGALVTSGPPSSAKYVVELYSVVDESAWLSSTRMCQNVHVSWEEGKCSVGSGGGHLVVCISRHVSLRSAGRSCTKASVEEVCARRGPSDD
ncbi:hypothetical protein BHM03_00062833 [Ensete ventricosum]|nr:hypothetical protein BHM03_00062833 [Ensete ventricosum]